MSDHNRSWTGDRSPEHYYNGALTNTVVTVTASPGNLYGFELQNNNGASEVFVQFFRAAAGSVTLGTTVPDFVIRVPAGANYGKDPQSFPIDFFGVALSCACTATRTGSGAPASVCSVNLWYWDKKF